MASNPDKALPALRLLAAAAAKLVDDVERGRLWDREFKEAISVLRKALDDAAREG